VNDAAPALIRHLPPPDEGDDAVFDGFTEEALPLDVVPLENRARTD
jgi:hypothetical protein